MQSSSPLTPPPSSLPEQDHQTVHLGGITMAEGSSRRGTKRKVSGQATDGGEDEKNSRRGGMSDGVIPKTPTKKRIEYVIDLCTPSPAANKFSDPLGLNTILATGNLTATVKRTPLTDSSAPNLLPLAVSAAATLTPKQHELQQENERSNYAGYLSLCRLTQQASQRAGSGVVAGVKRMSISRMDVSANEATRNDESTTATATVPSTLPLPPTSPSTAPSAEIAPEHRTTPIEPAETEQQKLARLASWKQRSARVVLSTSRNAVRARGMAPGKGMMSWKAVERGLEAAVKESIAAVTSRTGEMAENTLPTNLAPRPQPVVPTDTLHQTRTRYLQQFASHLHNDAHRVDPNPDHSGFRRREWSPVYACAYTHAAKRGGDGPKILALASESGTIKLIDTNASSSASSATTQFYPHSNAIFDLQWDDTDERILTASGDQLGAVHRLVEGGQVRREAILFGHTSSVKTCAWYDSNTVLTAGRDGNIHIYDLRSTGAFTPDLGIDETRYWRGRATPGAYWDQARISPVMSVRNAHGVGGGTGRKVTSRSAVRSVTSLLALKTDRNLIASGGSADGIVKFWDLRANLASTRRIYVVEPVSQTLDRTADRGRRSRGVISLSEAGGKVYALCNDARIHPHSIQSPQLALPTYYTHPGLMEPSFYMKLAVSPCEAFLACGTNGGKFAMWNVQRDYLGAWGTNRSGDVENGELGGEGPVNAMQGIECGFGAGHTRQVGALDWAADQIVTCSDDYSSRIWKPDPRALKAMRERKDGYEYWSGTVKVGETRSLSFVQHSI